MNIILEVSHEEERYSEVCGCTIPEIWVGRTSKIVFSKGSSLSGMEYPIFGNSKDEVISGVIEELKKMGLSGNLHVKETTSTFFGKL